MTDGIAILGAGCLFPGADGVEQFWRNLLDGVDATSLATELELGVDPVELFDPRKGQVDRTYWLRGGFVRGFDLDTSGFRLPPHEVAALDDVTRWSLHVARQALMDAGLGDASLDRCGMVLGNLSFPTRASHGSYAPLYRHAVESALRELLGRDDVAIERPTGAVDPRRALVGGTPASWVARALGLGAPSFCVDAACASSLYSLDLAARYLLSGKADLMLAGAVSCADPFFITMGFSIFQAYPGDGEASRPLDRATRGLVSGEGAGVFVLKRLADARRDGDRVLAVVRGLGLSNDGRGKHPLTPNPKGQLAAFERAYRAVEPATVPYVECHATGTPLGDPVELNAMSAFFGPRGRRPRVGSVKSNLGHMLTAAGMAGMTKAILSMRRGVIPPTIHVGDPQASDDGAIGGPGVVAEATPWPTIDGPRRVGVSAFGFGGTNAHVVFEEPGDAPPAPSSPPESDPRVAVVGLDLQLGGRRGSDARSDAPRVPCPPERVKGLLFAQPDGHYLDGFDVDFLRFRVPPGDADQPIAQQMLLLSVADGALRDAGIAEGGNVAVVVAMGAELELHQYRGRVEMGWLVRDALARAGVPLTSDERSELTDIAKNALLGPAGVNQYVSFIGNVMATRVSSLWDFSGPAFTVSADEASAARALEIAQLLLARGDVEAVVVAGVDLGGSAESLAARSGGTPADAAAAVVLVRAGHASARNAYATLDGSDVAAVPGPLASHAPAVTGLVDLIERVRRGNPGRRATPPAAVEPARRVRVRVGGRPVRSGIVTEENARRFGRAPVPNGAHGAMPVDARPAPIDRRREARPVAVAASAVPAQPPLPALARVPAFAEAGAAVTFRTAAHRALLGARREAARHVAAVVGREIDLVRGGAVAALAEPPPRVPLLAPTPPPPARPLVWDEADLLEFARGSIARVFGPEYAPIDAYRRRVRLPMPPYLLVSRVTHLDAERGQFRPSKMTTEYDIPHGAWYSVDGQVPWAVSVESGQCDLLLISYLGIDFENRGERVYRLLDCTLTFLDRLPREGDTLRYEISIDSFARSGDNLLFFFSYDCFVGDRRVLEMRGGCAGFFSDAELDNGRGVIYSDAELAARAAIEKRRFAPLLPCTRRSFGATDLDALSAGDLRACFGAAWETHGLNPSLRLPPAAIRMVDRVVSVDPEGGAYGLGLIVAEKELRPDDWYFPCHFKDDEVLAGSLMADGCGQLLQLYMLFLGFHTRTQNARFQPIPGLGQVVRCRGQVTPKHSLLTYRMEITDLGADPMPFARADVEIVVDGKVVVHFRDLALRLEESAEPSPLRALPAVAKPALLDERHVETFATGLMSQCFGPDYEVYDRRAVSRQPNGELKLISRVLEVRGTRFDLAPGSTIVTEFDVPTDAWFYRQSAYPDVPYSILMELALQPCGLLSAWLGSTLLYPEEDFHFRNLDGNGRLLRSVDLRGKTLTNRVRLLTSTSIQGVILQSFDFSLECDGEPYFVGDASFGYFSTAALANQVGLDAGRSAPSWLEAEGAVPDHDLDLQGDAAWLFATPPARPNYRLAGQHFDLLDRVEIVERGGRFGEGYVRASHPVDPDDWFYARHFYQDPVMPGSLGIEAILEALQAFAIRLDLGRGLRSPHFAHPVGHTVVWKYRGQIVPGNGRMLVEAHVKRIHRRDDGGLDVVADASLWRDDLRIYEVTDLALRIVEA